ncbi:MAG: FHA domain-containing protein [Verrucomicrobiota bacterium]
MSSEGNSSIFSFKEMLQHYAQTGKTGLFEVSAAGSRGRVYITNGSVIHAETGSGQGEAAALQVISWKDPLYEWKEDQSPADASVAVPVQDLLLKAIINENTEKASPPDKEQLPNSNAQTRNILDPNSVKILSLEISSNELKPFRFVIKKKQMTVGRDEANELCLAETSVSRKHAMIINMNDNLIIRDLGSLNGTMINGQVITEGIAKKDQIITFGECNCRLNVSIVRKVPTMSKVAK